MKLLRVTMTMFLFLFLGSSALDAQSASLKNDRKIITSVGQPIADILIEVPTEDIIYLGQANIDDLKLLGNTPTSVSTTIGNAQGKKHTYSYRDFIIQTNELADLESEYLSTEDNPELFHTLRALIILRTRYSYLYQRLVIALTSPNVFDNDIQNQWFNRYPYIVISFNQHSPSDVAISGTWLNSQLIPFRVGQMDLSLYENIPFISINSELIKGENQQLGSYPIYKLQEPKENHLAYLKEGLLHSIVHELVHRYIDIHNNRWNTVSNYISFGNGRKDRGTPGYDDDLYNFEEILVNNTIEFYFRKSGGMSDVILNYYKEVEENLIGSIPAARLSTIQSEIGGKANYHSDMRIEF